MKIILVMGLPGAGKTTLANEMAPILNAKRLNADEVRKAANDWDFSEEGRVRQAKRMAEAALKLKADGHYVIADFIAPTPEARKLFPADFIVWVDTIDKGRYDDTNQIFQKPKTAETPTKQWKGTVLCVGWGGVLTPSTAPRAAGITRTGTRGL